MKKLPLVLLGVFTFFNIINSFSQNVDEVAISQPVFNQNDTGLIYQDTTNGKVYSYINSELGTQEINFNSSVDQASDILQRRFSVGKRVFVQSTGALYTVQADSIPNFPTDSCVVIPTKNGKYAILQTKDRGFYVEHFGAIPNDGLDDSEAIQKCIDAVIKLKNSSRVNIGPGVFDLNTGLVMATATNYFITMTFSGHIPSYSPNQALSSTTVFKLHDATFGVAVQAGRNCLIENIVFVGSATYFADGYFENKYFIESPSSDWGIQAGARTNPLSPSCAIAIDPFDSRITGTNRYPNHNERYVNSKNNGTSGLTITGCSFQHHYIAIANNPSKGIQNGDNIRVENSHAKLCHTFWACGQTQSRSNSIHNIYSYDIRRYIDCSGIGNGSGTPPVVTNCNIAGKTKEFIRGGYSGFTPFRVSNTYMEGLFSLGYSHGTVTTFSQCQIKFAYPDTDIFRAPYQLKAHNISFLDCTVEFFGHKYQPLNLYSYQHVTFQGGRVQSGVVFTNSASSANLHYENTFINNLNETVGGDTEGRISSLSEKGIPLFGGDEANYTRYEGRFFYKNNGATNNSYYLGWVDFKVNHINKTGKFTTTEPGRYKVGDNLYSQYSSPGGFINPNDIGMPGPPKMSFSCYVSKVENDTITVDGLPYGVQDTLIGFFGVEAPILYLPIWGHITVGSNQIIITADAGSSANLKLPKVGARINHRHDNNIRIWAFPEGAYITAVDKVNGIITMSMNANYTSTAGDPLYFYNAFPTQEVHWSTSIWPPNKDDAFLKSSKVILKNPVSNGPTFYMTTKGGYSNPQGTPLSSPAFKGY